jgi:hypothetical protein
METAIRTELQQMSQANRYAGVLGKQTKEMETALRTELQQMSQANRYARVSG